jgi:hypothetical protein
LLIWFASSLSKDFEAGHFKKSEDFVDFDVNPDTRACETCLRVRFVGEADSFPGTTTPPLKLFFDLVNDHPARLIVR